MKYDISVDGEKFKVEVKSGETRGGERVFKVDVSGKEYEVVTLVRRGDVFDVIPAGERRWVKVRLADGREAWGHGYFLEVVEVPNGNSGLVDALVPGE